MTETLAHGYSPESAQQELSNEYQHDRVLMVFKDICILVLWTNVALTLEESKDCSGLFAAESSTQSWLEISFPSVSWTCDTFENNLIS